MQRRPVLLGVPAALLLVLLALPAAGTRLGLDLGIPALSDTPAGAGYLSATTAFGGSAVAPISVTACTVTGDVLGADEIAAIQGYVTRACAMARFQPVSTVSTRSRPAMHRAASAAPTWSGSSPTAPRSSALSAPVLAEQHDEWVEGRRYLGLDVLARSRGRTDRIEQEDTPTELTA